MNTQQSTATPFLPDMFIIDLVEDEQPKKISTANDALLASFVEGQQRVMGYGLVSNVFSSFLSAEQQALAS